MSILTEEYFEIEELASECGVTRRTVENWVLKSSPGLPVTYLGRKPLIARADLKAWLTARRVVRNERKPSRRNR